MCGIGDVSLVEAGRLTCRRGHVTQSSVHAHGSVLVQTEDFKAEGSMPLVLTADFLSFCEKCILLVLHIVRLKAFLFLVSALLR